MSVMVEGALALAAAGLFWRARQTRSYAGTGAASAFLLVALGGWLAGLALAKPDVAVLLQLLVVATALLSLLVADRSLDRPPFFFVGVLGWTLAAIAVVSADNLFVWWAAWVAWGGVSLGLTALSPKSRPFRLLLWMEGLSAGAAGAGCLLLGGASGAWRFEAIAGQLGGLPELPGAALLAGVFLVLAFALKVGLFPLHQWVWDAWRHVAPPVFVLLVSGQFVVWAGSLFRWWTLPLSHDMLELKLVPLWMTVSVLSMLGGALLALAQRGLMRQMQALATCQAGLWLLGLIASQSPETFYAGMEAGLFHLIVLLASQAVALTMAVYLMRESQSHQLFAVDGLARRSGFWALVWAGGLLSWVGLPPMVGFVSHWQLMAVVSEAGDGWLAGVAVVATLVSTALVLQLLRRAYGLEPVDEEAWRVPSGGLQAALVGSLALLMVLLVAPGWIQAWIGSAVTLF